MFVFYARKTKNPKTGDWEFPENPVYDAVGREGSTAEPGDTIEITKKSGETVDRVVKRQLHQFKSGDTVYELWPLGEEPGVTRAQFDVLADRVTTLEEQLAAIAGKQDAPF